MGDQRSRFLDDMVLALVREFGANRLRDALQRAMAFNSERLGPIQDAEASSPLRGADSRKKLSAVDMVARAELSPARRDAVKKLAESYDKKIFLPSPPDIREFLIMSGERPLGFKDRTTAFRSILPILNRIPVERLNEVVSSGAHSGPVKLSTISDAISAASDARRRQLGSK